MAAPADIAASAVDTSPASAAFCAALGLRWLLLPASLPACFFAPDASPYTLCSRGFCFKCFPFSAFQFFSFCGASCHCLYVNRAFPVSRLVSVACCDPLLNIHFGV